MMITGRKNSNIQLQRRANLAAVFVLTILIFILVVWAMANLLG